MNYEQPPDPHFSPEERARQDKQLNQFLGLMAGLTLLALYYVVAEFVPGPWGAPRFYDRGLDFYKDRKYDEAEHWFGRAIEINSDYYQAYFARAAVHRRRDQIDAAIADYTSAIRLKPDLAYAFYNRGLIYGDVGDPERALADFDAYVRLKPAEPDGHQRRAAIYRDLGDIEHALAEHDALVRLNDHELSYYFGRSALRRDFGDLAGALRDLDAAIAIAPKEPVAYLERGLIRRQNGDSSGAIADFEQAIALVPESQRAFGDVRPYLARGETFRDLGRTDAAKAEFDGAIKLRPGIAPGYQQLGLLELFVLDEAAAAADDLDAAVKKGFEFRAGAELMSIGIQVIEQKYGIAQTRTDEPPMLAPDVPFFPSMYSFVLWRHLARLHAAQPDAEFEPDGRKLGVDLWQDTDFAAPPVRTDWRRRVSWPGPILALFAGKATPETVRRAAEAAPGAYERRRRICEADFYLAEYQLAKGAGGDARKLLQSAVDGCPAGVPEATFAKAELQRLEKPAPK
jgi:tetratricopeptide (TPR) repeat protein